jgi:hypothetical protein
LLRPELNDVNNVRVENLQDYGDVDEGFQNSDQVISFQVTMGEHASAAVEPFSGVVDIDKNGHAEVWFHGQGFNVAEEVVGVFTSQARWRSTLQINGGTFGGQFTGRRQWPLWPALKASKRLGRPMKKVWKQLQPKGQMKRWFIRF